MGKKKNVKIKGKTKHTKSTPSKKYNAYKVEDGKIVRTKKICVKCGQGVYMAEHKDRYHCGSCGYTLFKKKE
ncbi:MAG: 30S ribosomal protein S27ae [Candidatus Nanoarchaeia archaeon]|jgi:small subunit ribosomal protein S27Ae